MISFTVLGDAQPAGSKRGFVVNGRAIVTDANKKSKPWQQEVKSAALEEIGEGFDLLTGPLEVKFTFYRLRPAGHYNTRGDFSAAGRRNPYPITRPDALKLSRGAEDALTGLVWRDDSQIVDEHLFKRYGTPARLEVEIRELA